MRQFRVVGTTFEQQCCEVERALTTFAILTAIEQDGKCFARRIAHLAEQPHFHVPPPVAANKSAALAGLAEALSSVSGDEGAEVSPEYDSRLLRDVCTLLCSEFRTSSSAAWDWLQFNSEYGTGKLVEGLQRCARAVLRSPVRGDQRPAWIRLSQQTHRVKGANRAAIEYHEQTREQWVAHAVAHAYDLGGDSWQALTDAVRRQEADERAMDDEMDEFDEAQWWLDNEGPDERRGVVAAEEVAEVAAPLAAFAADHQNVHTAPARAGAERAIALLVQGNLLDAMAVAYEDRLRARPPPAHMAHFLVEDVSYEIQLRRINADGTPHWVTVSRSPREIVEDILAFMEQTPAIALGLARALVSASEEGSMTITEVLCEWNPALRGSPEDPAVRRWATYRDEALLQDIHRAWADAYVASNAKGGDAPAWCAVLDTESWEEFRNDVDTVKNFGISYGTLLKHVWAYIRAQPAETTHALALRLAEEVLDGLGMCAQGKVTRLTNVLRGFHPGLDDVPVLSAGEELQHRIAALRAMPLEERMAAADAVFTELGIPAADQGAWREALEE